MRWKALRPGSTSTLITEIYDSITQRKEVQTVGVVESKHLASELHRWRGERRAKQACHHPELGKLGSRSGKRQWGW